MRAFWVLLTTIICLVALTIICVSEWPQHWVVIATTFIITAGASAYVHERGVERSGSEPDALTELWATFKIWRANGSQLLRAAHFPALWGVTAGFGSAFAALFFWHCQLSGFLATFGIAFTLAFAASLAISRLTSGSWRMA